MGNLHLVVIFVLCLMSVVITLKSKGPYKTTSKTVKPCNKTSLPRPKPELGPMDELNLEVYRSGKTNLVKGNLTIRSNHKGLMVHATAYIRKMGRWMQYIEMSSLECKNAMVTAISKMSGIEYDQDSCSLKKGFYVFTQLDMNVLEHMWAQDREYGRVLWKIEVITKVYSLHCYLLETIVQPKKS